MNIFIEILKFFIAPLIVGLIILFLSKKIPSFRIKNNISKSAKTNKEKEKETKVGNILYLISLIILGISIGYLTYFLFNNFIFDDKSNMEGTLEEYQSEIITKEEYNLSIISNCDTPGQAYSVFIDGDYAYIADFDNGLQIINIIDKENPKIVGNCDIEGEAIDVFIEGFYAYVLVRDIDDKFVIINIENKEKPRIVNFYELKLLVTEDILNNLNNNNMMKYKYPNVKDIYVNNNTAYIVDTVGLKIFDVANKNNIKLIGSCYPYYFAEGIFIEGNYAYIADNIDGIQIVDIKEKYKPEIIGMIDTNGEANDLYIENDFVYVADGTKGVCVAHIGNKNSYSINKSINFDIGYVEKIIKDKEHLLVINNRDISMLRIKFNATYYEWSDCCHFALALYQSFAVALYHPKLNVILYPNF